MFKPRRFCSALIAAIASVATTVLAMAEIPSKKSVSIFPEMLNEPIMSDGQDDQAVFQISQSWGRLLKGSRLMGKYHLDNNGLTVCIQRIFFVDRREQNTVPGQCLAKGAPAPDAVIFRKANGTLIVPQAQPFYLYDMPAEWERDDGQR
jgi:hypothetical protein